MAKCDIQCWHETDGNLYSGIAVAKAECKTHNWDMTSVHHLKGNELCPIGRIEEATDHAINLIRFHARQGK